MSCAVHRHASLVSVQAQKMRERDLPPEHSYGALDLNVNVGEEKLNGDLPVVNQS